MIAMRPMLNAGYDVRLASGVITAGGTLGILIPPSVMIIVYAAVAGQSVVKLYAAAMFPGFFLSFLYLVYIVGWALINPKVAPKLPEEQLHVPAPAWTRRFESAFSRRMLPSLIAGVFLPGRVVGGEGEARVTYPMILKNLGAALLPLLLVLATFYSVWWYVVIHSQADVEAAVARSRRQPHHEALLGLAVLRQHGAHEHAAKLGNRPIFASYIAVSALEYCAHSGSNDACKAGFTVFALSPNGEVRGLMSSRATAGS